METFIASLLALLAVTPSALSTNFSTTSRRDGFAAIPTSRSPAATPATNGIGSNNSSRPRRWNPALSAPGSRLGYREDDINWLVEEGVLTLGYQSSGYFSESVPRSK